MKILLLDIDGVFNSLGVINNPIAINHNWGKWQLTQENVNFLIMLSEYVNKNENKIYWVSTWENDSNIINKTLGISEFQNVYTINKKESVDNVIRTYPNEDILLVDDEYKDERIQCIQPNQRIGLTEKERNFIINWYNKK